jgi:hypothetical protein
VQIKSQTPAKSLLNRSTPQSPYETLNVPKIARDLYCLQHHPRKFLCFNGVVHHTGISESKFQKINFSTRMPNHYHKDVFLELYSRGDCEDVSTTKLLS